MKPPFFIVGAPRSGTTLLRDILRQHRTFECPEETSFYRWSEPFATRAHARIYRDNGVVCEHREKDGFSDAEFWEIYETATTRLQLQDLYMGKFLEKKGNPDGRWFEKTPQNTAGLLRLLCDYPEAKIIHLYRSPLNVVSSIREGKTVGPQSLLGAVNIWLEAVRAAKFVSRHWPEQILQVGYEALTISPETAIGDVLDFVGAAPFVDFPSEPKVWPMNLRYLERLEPAETAEVLRLCHETLRDLDYPVGQAAHEAFLREQNSLAKGRPPTTLKKKLARFRRQLTKARKIPDDSAKE